MDTVDKDIGLAIFESGRNLPRPQIKQMYGISKV